MSDENEGGNSVAEATNAAPAETTAAIDDAPAVPTSEDIAEGVLPPAEAPAAEAGIQAAG